MSDDVNPKYYTKIKYLTRWKHKHANPKQQKLDLQKAKRNIELLIQYEERKEK